MEADLLSDEPWDACNPSLDLGYSLVRDPEPETASHVWIPNSDSGELINAYCSKVLSLGVKCYTTIGS